MTTATEELIKLIVYTSLTLSAASFVVFVLVTLAGVLLRAAAGARPPSPLPPANANASPDDWKKWLETAGTTTEVFSKLGPAITALAASILFLAIAIYTLPPYAQPTAPNQKPNPGGKIEQP